MTERRALLLAAAWVLAVAASVPACWLSQGIPQAGGAPDADADTESESEPGCDEQGVPIYNDPARVLILQDHSSSMAGENWDTARSAIYDLLDAFAASSIEFGLDTLPDATGEACTVSAPIVIDCGPGTEAAIHAALAGMTTVLSTPLLAALERFLDPGYAPGCTETEYEQYILLIADGEDSCSSPSGAELAEVTGALVELGVRVIVVGFNVVWSSEQLDTIAANGGTAFTTYLVASDGPSLYAALESVASSIDSCVFTIDSAAAAVAPELVNVYLDGEALPMDDDCSSGSGWRWADAEHALIELCAESCAQVLGAGAGEISATFGCETVEGE